MIVFQVIMSKINYISVGSKVSHLLLRLRVQLAGSYSNTELLLL